MRRVPIILAYAGVFWLALPWTLLVLARAIDARAGWAAAGSIWGLPLLTTGGWLLAAGMVELWRGGGGLPIGALPPPRFTRRGPYRLVRHPIYVGFNLGLIGVGLWLGSPGLTLVIAPAFLPVWMTYAWIEERGLVRRFGSEYRRYQRQVGMLPRIGLYRLSQLAMWLGVLRWRAEGRSRVPRRGPVVLAFNHATFFDPAYLGAALRRPVHFLTTAEAYRQPGLRWLVSRYVNIPLRRYRQDVVACREMLRVLGEGGVIGMAVEGERSTWGDFRGALPDVAAIAARLGVPVVPAGISGSYDAGPRWASRNRRRPVTVRFGTPLRLQPGNARERLDAAIRALIDRDPQPVHLAGLDRSLLYRVLWRCPACGSEPAWSPASLRCGACGFEAANTADGRFRLTDGSLASLAVLGERVLSWPDDRSLTVEASVWQEDSWFGAIGPLRCLGTGPVTIGPGGIASPWLTLAAAAIARLSTERADTLQVTTRSGMWQLRPAAVSVFRLEAALRRWAALPKGP